MNTLNKKLELLITILAKLDPLNTGCNFSKSTDAADEYYMFAEYSLELLSDSKYNIYSAIEHSLDELASYRSKLTLKQREYINDNFLTLYS